MPENNYVIRVLDSPLAISSTEWNSLLMAQSPDSGMNPFMRHEYLVAMHKSGSATPETGWTPRIITLRQGDVLAGACALYLKTHSYGEYVFDWAWANAYQQHGLAYYPKAVVAPPFTPVPGARLLARDAATRALLVQALVAWCEKEKLSSLHLLFAADEDVAACEEAGLMLRHNVQFHWQNKSKSNNLPPTTETGSGRTGPAGAIPAPVNSSALSMLHRTGGSGSTEDIFCQNDSGYGYRDFDDFLMTLSQEKRKKIRQERRKVAEAGVTFRWSLGEGISKGDWDFFYQCYERTYYEHGNAPYLSRDFFARMARTMPENWLLFVAERRGRKIATSLIAVDPGSTGAGATDQSNVKNSPKIAYGRYWGALERVDCLHFEACYYQPLAWCIEHGYQRFEGGAQGEHKMARALLPVKTTSAHWLAHPSFADAVERFLAREGEGIENYMEELERRSPFRQAT